MEDLGDFCARNGYNEFAEYARQSNVQNTLLELTEALIRERPEKPREFLACKLKEELPDLGKKACLGEHVIPIHQVIHLFEGTRRIAAEIVPKETINVIIKETTRLLNCDRVSVFVYNARIGMLILTASNLTKPIRVNPGQGIAGYVFTTKTSVNIPDCYQDSRFDQKFDKITGYYTKSMIVVPIVDHDGEALGVLQAINKMAHGKLKGEGAPQYEPFGEMDMRILDHLTQLVGVALRNAEIYREAIIASERSQGLLAMLSSLSQDLGAQSTILTVTMHAKQLVLADQCLCFIIDGKRQTLWSIAADTNGANIEVRIPLKAENCVSQCVELKDIVAIAEDGEEDMVHLSKILHMDREPESAIHTMLCVPIRCQAKCMLTTDSMGGSPSAKNSRKSAPGMPFSFGEDAFVLGAICLINKRELDEQIATFTDEDIAVVDKFSRYVGDSLASSKYIRDGVTATPAQSEGNFVFGTTASRQSTRRPRGTTVAIEEENISDSGNEREEDPMLKRASCPSIVGKRLSLKQI